MPSPENLADQNPVDVPLYTYPDAARYLRLPISLILTVSSRHHPIHFVENSFVDDNGIYHEDVKPNRLSFRSLASLFIATSALRPFTTPYILEMTNDAINNLANDVKVFTDPEFVMSRLGRIDHNISQKDRDTCRKLIVLHQLHFPQLDNCLGCQSEESLGDGLNFLDVRSRLHNRSNFLGQ